MSSIVGIDEVGRGPWAGPLVVCAVLLGDAHIEGLTDSKKLSKRKREALAPRIMAEAKSYGLGWVDAAELDDIGLSAALRLATRRAVEQISGPYQQIIIDGTVNFLADTGKGPYVTTIKKADLLIASVSAASIIAKVARDDYMSEQAEQYPGYGFEAHVGYGTVAHKNAIQKQGLTPLHRRSFAPIAAIAGIKGNDMRSIDGTNKHVGNQSETVAAQWLKENGFIVTERNWKTKYCEIDIVAEKDRRLYFVEVKHRKTKDQGGGLAAITPTKLRRMKFAVLVYQKFNQAYDIDSRLVVVTTTGSPPMFESILELE